MKKRVLAMLLAVTMVTGCSLTPKEPDTSADAENSETVSSTDVSTGNEKEDEAKADTEVVPVSTSGRTSLLGGEEVIYYDPDLVPSVPGCLQ